MTFKNHPRLILFAVNLFLLGIVFGAFEIFLKYKGYHPGFVAPNSRIKNINYNGISKGYTSDSSGIFRISKEGKFFIDSMLSLKSIDEGDLRENSCYSSTLFDLIYSYSEMEPSYDYQSELKRKVNLWKFQQQELDEVQRAYIRYMEHPVNNEGFRSIEMRRFDSEKISILLIGDSFTWGYAGKPYHQSFADNLAAKGFIVYNCGITGSDPIQYFLLAQKYVPELLPDFVIINFYMGNDVLFYDRGTKQEIAPLLPIASTLIDRCPLGECWHDPEKAFGYASKDITLACYKSIWWLKWASKTRVTTLLAGCFSKYVMSVNCEEAELFKAYEGRNLPLIDTTGEISIQYLRQIQKITQNLHSKLIVAAIPDMAITNPHNQKFFNPEYFKELPAYFPNNLTKDDYNKFPDGHFNNSGHKKFSDFLERIIVEETSTNQADSNILSGR